MICPDCKGEKESVANFVLYSDGRCGAGIIMKCLRCKGEGSVPDAMADWIVRGKAMRDRRVHGKPYRNLGDEARRRGLDVVTLSAMETGRIEPVEDASQA